MLPDEGLSGSLERQGSALSTSLTLSGSLDISRKGCLKGGMSRSWSSSALSKSPSLSSISLRDGAQRAYTRLMQGNTRSVQAEGEQRSSASSEEYPTPKLMGGGRPYAALIACGDCAFEADSVFDIPSHDVVVIRVDGLLANGLVMKKLLAAIVDHGVRLVVVMSHSGCVAVKTCLDHWLEQNKEPAPNNFRVKQTTSSNAAGDQVIGRPVFSCFWGSSKTPVKGGGSAKGSPERSTPDESIARSPVPAATPPMPPATSPMPPPTPPIAVPRMAPVSPNQSSSASSETSLPSASDLSVVTAAAGDDNEVIKHPVEQVVRVLLPCVEKVAVTRVKQSLAKHAEANARKDGKRSNKYYVQAPVSHRRARALRLQAIDAEPETVSQVGQASAAASAQALLKALVAQLDPAIAREVEVVSAHLDCESGQVQPLKRGWWAHHTYYYEALGNAPQRQLMSASSGDLDALFGAGAGRRFSKSQYKALGGLPFGTTGNASNTSTSYALNSMMY